VAAGQQVINLVPRRRFRWSELSRVILIKCLYILYVAVIMSINGLAYLLYNVYNVVKAA